MAQHSKHHPRALCVELPTERDALEVAERIANKLAEGSRVPRGRVVRVIDEHGNVVSNVRVPAKH
jgi:hypothetical protein